MQRLPTEDFLFETPSYADPRIAGKQDCLTDIASVSELYMAIRRTFEAHPEWIIAAREQTGGEHHLFLRASTNRDHPDYQLQVYDLPGVRAAIDNIMEQGEGAAVDAESYTDSHYYRFRQIAAAWNAEQIRRPWHPAYPVLVNPRLTASQAGTNAVTDSAARGVMDLFNECFWLSMQLMAAHFDLHPAGSLRRSRLMNASIDFMTGLMRPLGEVLMTMPSGIKGKNAGPSFELPRPILRCDSYSATCGALAKTCRELEERAKALAPWMGRAQQEMLGFYAGFFMQLEAGTLSRFA